MRPREACRTQRGRLAPAPCGGSPGRHFARNSAMPKALGAQPWLLRRCCPNLRCHHPRLLKRLGASKRRAAFFGQGSLAGLLAASAASICLASSPISNAMSSSIVASTSLRALFARFRQSSARSRKCCGETHGQSKASPIVMPSINFRQERLISPRPANGRNGSVPAPPSAATLGGNLPLGEHEPAVLLSAL